MPWNTVDLMDEKLRFIHLAKSGRFTMTELCYDFSISRKTGHKYLIATIKKKKKKQGTARGVMGSCQFSALDREIQGGGML